MHTRGPTGSFIRRPRLSRPGRRLSSPGQALVLFALFAFVIVGFMALSVDGGFILAERRQVQTAADAGALAAAKAVLDNRAGIMVSSGQTYAAANAAPGAAVQVLRPPATGAYAGNNDYIQVVVTQDVQQFFVGALYTGAWNVTASATAGVETEPANYALITLERNATPGIYLNGTTGIVITGDEASAMANTNIHSNGVTSFTTTGTIDANTTIAVGGGAWNPAGRIRENQPQIDDPLGAVPVPPKGPARTFAADCPGDVCQPGWYRNQDVTLSGTWTFAPGVYYFENTDVALQNTNARIQGTDVLLYFDSNSSFDPKNGEVHLTGDPTPQYAGGQPGMVFWYDRCNTLDMQGNAELYFNGIFYAPCALVQMRGTPGQESVNGQLIVSRLDVRGTADLGIVYHSWVDTDRPRVYLVE
ncbi:MAG TPA: pilus assembly protein TadG-related protein [Thermomicrobiales bacterium]|nr:pilus assembly protein TadG-related protein [Thermomicrobiales bacterium]